MDMTASMPSSEKPSGGYQVFGAAFLLAVIFAVVGLGYITYNWMTDVQRLPLSRLVVKGDLVQVTPESVRDQLMQGESVSTFMTQDVNVLQQEIEAMPWVEQASVRKQWPDLIKVYITEHKPGAVWNSTALLDVKGDVFQGDPSLVDQDLPQLFGPDADSAQVLEVWKETKKRLNTIGRNMDALVFNDRRAWQIILDNGIRLELGKDSRQERLERFIRLYQTLGDK
ncbi:MAG: cell division protein FtsQ/DivIB, partial [Vibrio sp.]